MSTWRMPSVGSSTFTARAAVVLLCAVYFVVLNWSYANVESELYGECPYFPPPFRYQLFSCAIALIPSLWLTVSASRPSNVCLWLLYLTVYLPTTFLCYHVSSRPPEDAIVFSMALLAMMLIVGIFSRMRPLPLTRLQIDQTKLHVFLLATTLGLIVLLSVTSGGLRLNFSLQDVYQRRETSVDVSGQGTLLSYAISSLAGCFAPVSLAIGFSRKDISLVCVGLLGTMSVFFFDGSKAVFFSPILLLAMMVSLWYAARHFALVFVAGAIAVVVLAVCQYTFTGSYELSAYLVRRQFIVPGVLSACYWDFFSVNPHVYYADRFMSFLLVSPYNLSTSRLIGDTYLFSDANSANANVWASAYANAGYVGMTVTTIVLGAVFRFLDSVASQGDAKVACLMAAMFGIVWSNGALETSMLSNGVFLALVVLYVLRDPADQARKHLVRMA